jgi:ElaB/YqjD/DUF883 family membrane-anchored ribosome-binding protein
MKSCPFCYQDDLDDRASKCPHCAAWLDGKDREQPDFNELRREVQKELRESRQDYQEYLKSIFNRVQLAASIILALVIGASAWFGFRTDRSITEIKDEITSRIKTEFHSQKMQGFMTERIDDAIKAMEPAIKEKAEAMTTHELKKVTTQADQSSDKLSNLADQAAKSIEQEATQAREKLEQARTMIEAIERDLKPTRERLAQVEKTATKTNTAIVKAAQASVEKAPLGRPIDMEPKMGIGAIPDLVRKRPDALRFQLGHGGYYGPAIWLYLDVLGRVPEFRYVVVTVDNSLFGVFDAATLTHTLNPPNATVLSALYPLGSNKLPKPKAVPRWTEFADRLNRGDDTARKWIAALTGFVPAMKAVPAHADKRQALQKMETMRRDWLPVVDAPGGRLVGIVDRSNLTSSLLLEIAKGVDSPQ